MSLWWLLPLLCWAIGLAALAAVRPAKHLHPTKRLSASKRPWWAKALRVLQKGSFYVNQWVFVRAVEACYVTVRWPRARHRLPPRAPFLSFEEFYRYFPFRFHRLSLQWHRDLGKVVYEYIPGVGIMVFVADAALVEQLLKDKKTFPTRGVTGFSSYVPRGLLALPTGAEWQFHRRLLSNVFTDRALQRYSLSIGKEVSILLSKWGIRSPLTTPSSSSSSSSTTATPQDQDQDRKTDLVDVPSTNSSAPTAHQQQRLSQHGNALVVNAQSDLVALTFDIIGRISSGAVYSTQANPQHPLLRATSFILDETLRRTIQPKMMWNLPPRRARKFADALALARAQAAQTLEAKMAANRQTQHEPDNRTKTTDADKNMLYLMQNARVFDESSNKANGLTMEDIYQESMTLIGAGHETTSNTLSWTLMLLATHPTVQDKLHQELVEVMAGDVMTFAEAKAAKYARMVFYETLRLYPTVPFFPRVAAHDTEIGGYFIPAGSYVFVSQLAMNRDPSVWDKPEEFIPERFEQQYGDPSPSRPVGVPGGHAFGFVPFGAGPRTCIGQRLAVLEGIIILASIIRNFTLELAQYHDDNPVDEHTDITLGPKKGLFLRVTPRRPL